MPGTLGQTRISNVVDGGVALQKKCDRQRIRIVSLDTRGAACRRCTTACGKFRGNGMTKILALRHHRLQQCPCRRQYACRQVAMSAQVFGGALHDKAGAQFQRLLIR